MSIGGLRLGPNSPKHQIWVLLCLLVAASPHERLNPQTLLRLEPSKPPQSAAFAPFSFDATEYSAISVQDLYPAHALFA
jgi:hypothetical protein